MTCAIRDARRRTVVCELLAQGIVVMEGSAEQSFSA